MTERSEQLITKSPNGVNLPDNLRQISAALWEAVERHDLNSASLLLDQRQTLIEQLASGKISDDLMRELRAMQAANRYLTHELQQELNALSRRLNGIQKRRAAFSGYRNRSSKPSHVQRTG